MVRKLEEGSQQKDTKKDSLLKASDNATTDKNELQ